MLVFYDIYNYLHKKLEKEELIQQPIFLCYTIPLIKGGRMSKKFSKNEIMTLISKGSCKIEKGDTVEDIALALRELFSCLAQTPMANFIKELQNDSANKTAFHKEKFVEGKYFSIINLVKKHYPKFFKTDTPKDEYIFSPADRLFFSVDRNLFWKVFITFNQTFGEYLRDSYTAQNLSSLPEKMSLNLKVRPQKTSPLITAVIKTKLRYRADNIISLSGIGEASLTVMGAAINENTLEKLIKALIIENKLKRLDKEKDVYIPSTEIEKIGTECLLEFYKNHTLPRKLKENLNYGFSPLTSFDKALIKEKGLTYLLPSLLASSEDISLTKKYRTLVDEDKLVEKELFLNRVFVISNMGLANIKIAYNTGIPHVSSSHEKTLKIMCLYANFLGANITTPMISSTVRTVEKQVELILDHMRNQKPESYAGSRTVYAKAYTNAITNGSSNSCNDKTRRPKP